MWTAIVSFLRTWGLIVLLVAGGLGIAYRFVAPPPPQNLRIATGPGPDSADGRQLYALRRDPAWMRDRVTQRRG